MALHLDLDRHGRAFEYDVTYCEGYTRTDERPWQGWGVRYRPLGEHRLRVIFLDGVEAQPPSSERVLAAIAQHHDDEQAGQVRR